MELLPELSSIVEKLGPSGVFLFMLWRLWISYSDNIAKILGKYEEIISENTRVQALVVKALEKLADK